jgi:uncharacterized protein
MSTSDKFIFRQYEFNNKVLNEFEHFFHAKNLWPVVYILSDSKAKEAYVGETTDAFARMSTHLTSDKKNFTALQIFANVQFNKSATLDIESNLIKYLSGDGNFKLHNGNIGLSNHNYYQKEEVYGDIFKSIWNRLLSDGFARNSLKHIDNSDLFKYSPYKSLTKEQKEGLVTIIKSILQRDDQTVIVEGGAGTGKTILAVFLFKLLHTDIETFNFKEFGDEELDFIELVKQLKRRFPKPTTALVVPMSSFRNTLKKVFKNVKGLNAKMVIGPAELAKRTFDIVLVDESHRLRRRANLGSYFKVFDDVSKKLGFDKTTASELDWVLKQSRIRILFYDQNQSIKPSDVKLEDFLRLKAKKNTTIEQLKSQFRCMGGNDYIKHINRLFTCEIKSTDKPFKSRKYELVLFDSVQHMIAEIKDKNKEFGLSRLVAGYSWKWASKKKKKAIDITIDGNNLKWNSTSKDWVNSDNAINEVGCIHTTQGYDLNYTGVIFGNEITYDKEKNEIIIIKDNYYDTNGKNSIKDPNELKSFIINIYSTIMMRGIRGTYVYVCDPALREYFARYLERQ